jgi:hypothetical protein
VADAVTVSYSIADRIKMTSFCCMMNVRIVKNATREEKILQKRGGTQDYKYQPFLHNNFNRRLSKTIISSTVAEKP